MTFRYVTIVTTLAVLALPAPAQKSNIHADNNPDVVESVKKFELELCDLIVRGEWEAYASRLTDDYFRILPGKIQNKKEVLNDFRALNAKTISMVPEQMDVRIYGDTAIMIIQLRSREQTPDGHAIDRLGRATKVFVRRNDKWFLAQLTGSPLN
jgi:ketosteroid isomerase-like protein